LPLGDSKGFQSFLSIGYDASTDFPTTIFGLQPNTPQNLSTNATLPLFYQACMSYNYSSFVTGDPQFRGFQGQEYQVHGIDGSVYNLITDQFLQLNAEFTFLSRGVCTYYLRSIHSACWSHPGSYISKIGILTSSGEQAMIQAGGSSIGFTAVIVNGREMLIDDVIQANEGEV